MLERRRVPRTKVFKGAKLILAARSTVSCVVRNLTNQGALLQLPSTRDITTEFDLSFDKGRTLRKSHVVWQTFTKIGVSFDRLVRGRVLFIEHFRTPAMSSWSDEETNSPLRADDHDFYK